MTAQIIDGKKIAESIRNQISTEVAERLKQGKRAPGLAVILVGDNPSSKSYVSSKQKACREVGILSFGYELPGVSSQQQVEDLVRKLDDDPNVDGILVQLPLPIGLDEERILRQISFEKDVDGIHPINVGLLAQKGREPRFASCTPAGVIHLIKTVKPSLAGANVVVLGRSNIVGMPVALLLIREDATVTICHSRSRDLPGIIRQADVLVSAVGRAEMVKKDWIKPGAVVIDVGNNYLPDPTSPKGRRLVGDVDFNEVKEVAGWISPVPGGVGPMTIAMLLSNTLKANKQNNP